nr:Os08g0453716 [Ipomoea trifida]
MTFFRKECVAKVKINAIRTAITMPVMLGNDSMREMILWKEMLSSKGMMAPRNDSLRVVRVLLQTGRRMRAMLNFRVSAAPLADGRQLPMIWKAGWFLKWWNFQVKSERLMHSQSVRTHILFQFSRIFSLARDMNLFTGFLYCFGTMVLSLPPSAFSSKRLSIVLQASNSFPVADRSRNLMPLNPLAIPELSLPSFGSELVLLLFIIPAAVILKDDSVLAPASPLSSRTNCEEDLQGGLGDDIEELRKEGKLRRERKKFVNVFCHGEGFLSFAMDGIST